jgi:hypothetical protein
MAKYDHINSITELIKFSNDLNLKLESEIKKREHIEKTIYELKDDGIIISKRIQYLQRS